MKTHELANQLELLAEMLRSLPNTEIKQTISSILESQHLKPKPDQKYQLRQTSMLLLDVLGKIQKMTPADAEFFLNSDANTLSSAEISELAEKLGVQVSKRQNRSATINAISRFIEASQMDQIIRSTGEKNNENFS